MRDAAKRARFEWLRQREEEGTLTGAEQAEMVQMIEEIERAEAAYLRPATERLRADRVEVASQNEALQGVLQRKAALVRRLEQTLAEATAERDALAEEVNRILSGAAGPSL
jgi:hypothetical protein